jgi:predicted nucleic acid-binding protein
MNVAYVDTSCLVAVAFGERGAAALARRLEGFDRLLSSNLLEAEFRAACVRERVEANATYLAALSWVLPDRPLRDEIGQVLLAGQVRGADCWHLATALYLAGDPSLIAFLTLDQKQRAVANQLGFAT